MIICKVGATEIACLKVFNRYRRQLLLERMVGELSAITRAGSELKGERISWLPAIWQRLCQALLFPLVYLLLIFAAVMRILIAAISLISLSVRFFIPVRVNALPNALSVPAMFRVLNGDRLLDNDRALLCIEEWLVVLYGREVAQDIGFTKQVAEIRAGHVRSNVAAFNQGNHIIFVDPMSIVLKGLKKLVNDYPLSCGV